MTQISRDNGRYEFEQWFACHSNLDAKNRWNVDSILMLTSTSYTKAKNLNTKGIEEESLFLGLNFEVSIILSLKAVV